MKDVKRGVKQLAELANGLVDPVLARRAGISTALLGSWDEIVGESFADCSRPEKITWPRLREIADEGGHRPGVLTIACEGSRALFLSHAQTELVSRINSFFGYPAVAQIRIVQKPVLPPRRRKLKPLDAVKTRRIEAMVEDIESDKLKDAIRRLGRGVYGSKR